MEFNNPFSVVKATEYSDEEIKLTWVPFKEKDGKTDAIHHLLNPSELMPKYILGTKGCGKTHILRYFSYELRYSIYQGDTAKQLSEEKYIGIYSRLDGLSASRFNHKDNHQAWVTLYDYYFELYQAIRFLYIAQNIILNLNIQNEEEIVALLYKSLNSEVKGKCIADIIGYLNEIRVKIDRAIIDYAYTQSLNWDSIKPICKFGDIIFNIPNIICSNIHQLRDVKVIFILDEYEKLPCEWQKESLNTLVYEKKYNVTFWIGARRYGYTTQRTKTSEPIREGNEYQPIFLDEIIRRQGEKAFNEFAHNLLKQRLCSCGISMQIAESSANLFEEYDEKKLMSTLSEKPNLKHWNKLSKNILKVIPDESSANDIIEYLHSNLDDKTPIEQKFILFLFYQNWAKQNTISSDSIMNMAETAIRDFQSKNKTVREKFNKFRGDLLAQLAVENGIIRYIYTGLKDLISISDFNPRVFLTLLKLIIEDCFYKGYNPFISNKTISVQSQYTGIIETAKWFLSDVEVDGRKREQMISSIIRLIDYLYINRFCDKPTETSPCTFYYKNSYDVSECTEIIQLAHNESFLIKITNQRKDKSLGVPQQSYQLNKLIATLYNLPIARRGILPIGEDMFRAIFSTSESNSFNTLLMKKKQALNAPFKSVMENTQNIDLSQQSLFDIE